MRTLFRTALVAAAMALVGCTTTTEDLLVGSWRLDRATEVVASTDGTDSFEMQGYDDYYIEFIEEGYCAVTDRGVQTVYEWYLIGDETLVLARGDWAEDYAIDELTKQRLVYSDTYAHVDESTGAPIVYTYTFEYSKQ